ncbi:MAG: OadG family protein [Pseudomonadales bacterium]|nr:OadG family protein [Pseudomonadales bacterium]
MSPILSEGLNLMAFGMGTVFVFLNILIIATFFMSAAVERLIPKPVPKLANQEPDAPAIDSTLLKVLTAAITERKAP